MVPVRRGGERQSPPTRIYLVDVKERVRTILLTRIDAGVAGTMSRQLLRSEIAPIVREIATEERVQLNSAEETQLADELTADMVGLGPLEPSSSTTKKVTWSILVNGLDELSLSSGTASSMKTTARFRDAEHVFTIVQRIASAIGRRIDESSPMVDARLADGSRVNIVLPPLVLNGGSISIRKFSRRNITLEAMVQTANLSKAMARFLDVAARARFNIIISGGTGSGKTTLLNAMSRSIDPSERIITIEDAVELRLQQPHIVQMETRMANIEGVGEIPQRALVRNALRMRPDRIILGEVRGTEAFDMLQAMNTGHDGSMSTIHANTPRDALSAWRTWCVDGDAESAAARHAQCRCASAVNLVVVQVERMREMASGGVTSVVEVTGLEGDIITTRELFAFKYRGETRDGLIEGIFEPSPGRPALIERAAHFGLDNAMLEALGVKQV